MSDTATVPTQENGEGQNRTFTQDEVNAIVGKRLAEEKGKYADYEDLKAKAAKYDEAEEANKSELQKAMERATNLESELTAIKKENEVRTMRETVSKETGIPSNLLTGDTEEACKAQAEAIKAFAQPSGYPKVKDGGEISKTPSGNPKASFAEFMSQNFK
jgi:DNA invertase Pin-like site-specific DNA recombinase